MKNTPKEIYLNFEEHGEDFKDHDQITWSEEKINENDIKYVLESNQKEFEQILIQYVEEGEQLEHLIKDNPYLSGFHEACNKLLTKYKELNK